VEGATDGVASDGEELLYTISDVVAASKSIRLVERISSSSELVQAPGQ
jgi:hypothetical protein